MNYQVSYPATIPASVPGVNELLQFVDKHLNAPSYHQPETAETALSHLEAELDSYMHLFNKASLLSISDLKGKIIFANNKFCELSQYSRHEIIGKPHSIIHHPDTSPSMIKEMWRTIGSGRVWQGEIKNRAKDGSAFWTLATISPVMGSNGKPEKYISMRVDITAQKLAEEALREAKKKIDLELLESITYAKFVHSSFLSTPEDVAASFHDSLMIYSAQKIVSGDFYRVAKYGKKTVIVCGDSTGHGVSASYISVIVLNTINRLLKEISKNPASALKKMNKEIYAITHPENKKALIESADTIACCFDHEKRELRYASAKMRGAIIRNGEIIPLEKCHHSIGDLPDKEFELINHEVQLLQDDRVYLFSDGMFDQLGGKANKRIGYKRMSEFLKTIYTQPMSEQKKEINGYLKKWQGENEQTDDMTLLGWKVD